MAADQSFTTPVRGLGNPGNSVLHTVVRFWRTAARRPKICCMTGPRTFFLAWDFDVGLRAACFGPSQGMVASARGAPEALRCLLLLTSARRLRLGRIRCPCPKTPVDTRHIRRARGLRRSPSAVLSGYSGPSLLGFIWRLVALGRRFGRPVMLGSWGEPGGIPAAVIIRTRRYPPHTLHSPKAPPSSGNIRSCILVGSRPPFMRAAGGCPLPRYTGSRGIFLA